MTFDTFWAAIVEAIEVRTGQDLARKDIVIGMKQSTSRRGSTPSTITRFERRACPDFSGSSGVGWTSGSTGSRLFQ
jgi:hypothetical protein